MKNLRNARSYRLYIPAFYLLTFQNPLSMYIWQGFSYIDELFALIGSAAFFYQYCRKPTQYICRDTGILLLSLSGFLLCGIAGNLRFAYQPFSLILKDLYTHLKFFLAVLSGIYLLRYAHPSREVILRHCKICILFLSALLAIDLLFDIFPQGGIRYGFGVRCLIFGHATYFAGASVFLLSLVLLCYSKRELPYLVLGLILLVSTFRGKALAGAAVCVMVFWRISMQKKKPELRHFLLAAVAGILIAWQQIRYYYIDLAGQSARSQLFLTSIQILQDCFPIGTGFGTYGSDVAGNFYSPVYVRYGFLRHPELQPGSAFFSDTFWPIILGQTGFLGTTFYITALGLLFFKALQVRAVHRNAYAAVLFLLAYLLISSTSEPTFCNTVSIPPAMILGFSIAAGNSERRHLL